MMAAVTKYGDAAVWKVQIRFRHEAITVTKLNILPKVIQGWKSGAIIHNQNLALGKQTLNGKCLDQK